MSVNANHVDIVGLICFVGLPAVALIIWSIGDAIQKNRRPK